MTTDVTVQKDSQEKTVTLVTEVHIFHKKISVIGYFLLQFYETLGDLGD